MIKNDNKDQDNPTELTLIELIRIGEEKISKQQIGKDIIMVVGNTGAGKGTLITYLNKGLTIKRNEKKLLEVDTLSSLGNIHISNSGTESDTFYPGVHSAGNYSYVDCPGFGDSRGANYDIASAFFRKKAAEQCNRLKIVLVVSQGDIETARAAQFKKVVDDLGRFLRIQDGEEEKKGDHNKADLLKNSLTLVVTKVKRPEEEPDEGFTDHAWRKYLVKTKLQEIKDTFSGDIKVILDEIIDNDKFEIFSHFSKQGEVDPTEKEQIIELINNTQYIPGSILPTKVKVSGLNELEVQNSILDFINKIKLEYTDKVLNGVESKLKQEIADSTNGTGLLELKNKLDELGNNSNLDTLKHFTENISKELGLKINADNDDAALEFLTTLLPEGSNEQLSYQRNWLNELGLNMQFREWGQQLERITQACNPEVDGTGKEVTLKGYFPKISLLNKFLKEITHITNVTSVKIYGLHTVIFDENLDSDKIQEATVSIIAPYCFREDIEKGVVLKDKNLLFAIDCRKDITDSLYKRNPSEEKESSQLTTNNILSKTIEYFKYTQYLLTQLGNIDIIKDYLEKFFVTLKGAQNYTYDAIKLELQEIKASYEKQGNQSIVDVIEALLNSEIIKGLGSWQEDHGKLNKLVTEFEKTQNKVSKLEEKQQRLSYIIDTANSDIQKLDQKMLSLISRSEEITGTKFIEIHKSLKAFKTLKEQHEKQISEIKEQLENGLSNNEIRSKFDELNKETAKLELNNARLQKEYAKITDELKLVGIHDKAEMIAKLQAFYNENSGNPELVKYVAGFYCMLIGSFNSAKLLKAKMLSGNVDTSIIEDAVGLGATLLSDICSGIPGVASITNALGTIFKKAWGSIQQEGFDKKIAILNELADAQENPLINDGTLIVQAIKAAKDAGQLREQTKAWRQKLAKNKSPSDLLDKHLKEFLNYLCIRHKEIIQSKKPLDSFFEPSIEYKVEKTLEGNKMQTNILKSIKNASTKEISVLEKDIMDRLKKLYSEKTLEIAKMLCFKAMVSAHNSLTENGCFQKFIEMNPLLGNVIAAKHPEYFGGSRPLIEAYVRDEDLRNKLLNPNRGIEVKDNEPVGANVPISLARDLEDSEQAELLGISEGASDSD